MKIIVDENKIIADGIFSMTIHDDSFKRAVPGQFVNIYTGDGAHLLPRPISISRIDSAAGRLELVYRVAGFGTEAFSRLEAGSEINVTGPLGKGFIEKAKKAGVDTGAHAMIVGGGIGIPPMLGLSREWDGAMDIVLGYRDTEFLYQDFSELGHPVHTSSDNGSTGIKGTVIDAIEKDGIEAEVIFACGPRPMLAAIKALAIKRDIPCFLSLEERMACGVGACLGCVVSTEAIDDHSKVRNARVCADGPVFECREVTL